MSDATVMLERCVNGDPNAASELLPVVYDQLRAMAGSFFQRQPANHTLEPTALVHEAFIKLIRYSESGWESRAHFMAVAARAMRQILQDRARQRIRVRAAGQMERVTLSGVADTSSVVAVDLVALDDALRKLAELDADQARIVELRFFGGLNVEEVAHVMKWSKSKVEKEWVRIRAWLSRELAEAGP